MISEILTEHPWLWPLAWQSTLCLAAGLGGSFLLRRHAVRAHQVLLLALVAAMVIPALSQIVKRNQWGLLVAERAVATPQRPPIARQNDFAIPDRSPITTESANVPPATASPQIAPSAPMRRFHWARAILTAWLAVSSVLFLRLTIQFLLGRRLAKRSEAVHDSPILPMIEIAKDKLGVRADVEARVSDRTRSPVIWCWGHRPVLLVPSAPGRDDDRLDWLSILCHELAHARRRDHLSGLFAELMICVLPWQPLLWWARQRLAALSEEACDDWVIACGQRATGYARTLLGLIPQGQAAFLPGIVTSRGGLAGRVRRILEDGGNNPRAGVRWSLAAVALAGSIAVGVGFAQTRPAERSPAETKSSAASREQLNKILDAMLYHDYAVLPIALHLESDQYNLDAPADSQRYATNVIDQRLDGKRFDSSMTVHVVRDGQSRLGQVNRSVFTGDQYLYRQETGSGPSRLTAVLEPKDEASRMRAFYSMGGSTLFGYLPGDEKPVAALLQNATGAVLYDRQEKVDGFACDVIEGTTDHGTYKLWVDPERDYRIRRALIDKRANDLYYGHPVSTPRPEGLQDQTLTSVHLEISEVYLENLGGHFMPTAESMTSTSRAITGKENHGKIVVKRSQIDLKPDFEKLGAFVMDGIPEGTPLANFDPNDHTYAYEWHNGKAVSIAPDGGILVGRIQFSGHDDLSTVLTGKRRFDARFTREELREKGSHGLTLTPEKNGAFQVKDVPPGEYRLKLSLTNLEVEKAPSGGLMPRIKMLAEAEREFSIPESKEAAPKTFDLGVIEMTLPDTAESPGSAAGGEGAGLARGVPGQQVAAAESNTPPAQTASSDWPDFILSDGMVRLRLTDPNGRPVAGAAVGGYVQTQAKRPQWQWVMVPAQKSDETGEVIFDMSGISTRKILNAEEAEEVRARNLPRGAVYVFQREQNLGAVLGLRGTDAGKSLDVRLQPLCRVHGTVSSPALGATAALQEIRTHIQWQKIPVLQHSSQLGEIVFPLPPGEYTITVGSSTSQDTPSTDVRFTSSVLALTIAPGQHDLDLGDIKLHASKSAPPVDPSATKKTTAEPNMVRLRLVDPNGRPVAGAKVGNFMFVLAFAPVTTQVRWQPDTEISDENGQVTLNAEGYFFRGTVNKVAVYILHEERKIGAVHEIVRGAPKETLPVVLRPVCRVRGACDSAGLAALGLPLQSSFVDVLPAGDDLSLLYRGTNDPSHGFESLLPPGRYTLRAFGWGKKDSSFAEAFTEFQNLPITVPEGSYDLDVGVIDLRPTKWATMVGHPAPEMGPMKAWKNGPAVTLADLRGQVVWLRFADQSAAAFPDLRELVELDEALGHKGLTVIMISNWSSLEEFDQTWSKIPAKLSGGVREIPFRIAIDGDAAADRQGADKRRIGATFERYGIGQHPKGQPTDILIDPAGNVLGQPSVNGAKEAISQMLSERQGPPPSAGRQPFNEVYRLADGEILKRIAPPFLPERAAYVRKELGPQAWEVGKAMARDPDRIDFRWDGRLKMRGCAVGDVNFLGAILRAVIELKRYEYDGPPSLLALPLAGDWIVRDAAPREARLRALEELVARELGRRIRFEQRSVERDTIVATGSLRFHPPAAAEEDTAIHLSATETGPDEKALSGTAQSISEFLQMLGNVVNMPALNQTGRDEPIRMPYVQHRSSIRIQEVQDEQEKLRQVRALLNHVTEQTELQFEIRRESVPVWFVTEPTNP